MPKQFPSVDVASAASAYATFGFLLVGFAFTGLFFYLTDRNRQADPAVLARHLVDRSVPRPVEKRHVTLTALYAMASLLMTSFLYLDLAGEATPAKPFGPSPGWAVAALVPYGVAFGLSVLMLFYSLTLIMLEQSSPVADWSYWMVACVGPAVVLRFLLTAAASARASCACGPAWPLSRWTVSAIVVATAVLAAVLMLVGLSGLQARRLLDWLRDHPATPSILLFAGVAVMAGPISVYFTRRGSDFRPGSVLMTSTVWAAWAAVLLFALSCGCVIGPRVNVARPARLRQHLISLASQADRTGQGGAPAVAMARYLELVPEIERLFGAEHPETLIARARLAHWAGQAGGTATEARDQCMALVPNLERVLGPWHPQTLEVRALAACWSGQAGDATAARDQYSCLLPVCARSLGPHHPDTLTTWSRLAYWTGETGDAAAARDHFADLLPIQERVLGAEDPKTLAARSNLAHWTGEAGDATAARDQLAVLLRIQERVLGPLHLDTLTCRSEMARWIREAKTSARN